LNLVSNVQFALIDARAIYLRARFISKIDQGDVIWTPNFDDCVHPRSLVVVYPKVTLWVLTNLDDVLRHRLAALKSATLIECKREYSLCHAFGFLHLPAAAPRRLQRDEAL
jgi:hypothetical protein